MVINPSRSNALWSTRKFWLYIIKHLLHSSHGWSMSILRILLKHIKWNIYLLQEHKKDSYQLPYKALSYSYQEHTYNSFQISTLIRSRTRLCVSNALSSSLQASIQSLLAAPISTWNVENTVRTIESKS